MRLEASKQIDAGASKSVKPLSAWTAVFDPEPRRPLVRQRFTQSYYELSLSNYPGLSAFDARAQSSMNYDATSAFDTITQSTSSKS